MSINELLIEYAAGGGILHRDRHDPKDHYYDPELVEPKSERHLRDNKGPIVPKVYNQFQTDSCVANAAAAALWFEEDKGEHTGNWGDKGPSRMFIYWLARALGDDDDDNKFTSEDAKDEGSYTRDALKGIAIRGACSEDNFAFPDFDGPNGVYAKLTAEGKKLSAANIKEAISTAMKTKPPKEAYDDALPHKITNYYRIDLLRPDQTDEILNDAQKMAIGDDCLKKTKQCISEGYPVLFGYNYYLPHDLLYEEDKSGKYNYTNDKGETFGMMKLKDIWSEPTTTHDKNTSPGLDNTTSPALHNYTFDRNRPVNPKTIFYDKDGDKIELGGHAVLAIGYDEKYFFVQNSWGKGWSNRGVFLVPHSWVSDYEASNDFWTIRLEPVKQREPTLWEQLERAILGQVLGT